MVDNYRGDVAAVHNVLAFPRNTIDAVVDTGRQVFTGRDPVEQTALLRQTGCVAPAAFDARVPSHPDHRLYRQIDSGMRAVDASMGRSPDQFTERASAYLFAEAKMGGITQAEHVLMSTGGAGGAANPNLFVVQGALNDPSHLRVSVPSSEAVSTPVEQSFERAANHDRQQAQAQEQQRLQQEHAAPTRSM